MMTQRITGLKVQQKNPGRINVYLDGDFAFGMSRVVAAWLQVGQVLDEEKIEKLRKEDTFEVALQKAFHFLSFRMRSEAEIHNKLIEQGYGDEIVQRVLERLRENGLVNDQEFTRRWIENRNTFRPRSRRALMVELKRKGVTEEVIQTTLAEETDDDQAANEAACRYVKRIAGLDWPTFREKLGAYLMRRGFSYGTVVPVVQKAWSDLHSAGGQPLEK
jgi:regulatory protein